MKISVVIPSFNGEKRLPKIFAALKPQLQSGDEILVVDDASTDATTKVAENHGARVIRLEINSGVGKARNQGGHNAQNEILLFFDDDIIPQADYLKVARELFEKPDRLCCQGLHSLEPANDQPTIWHHVEAFLWRNEMGSHQSKGKWCNSLFSQSFCIRREHFLKTGGFFEGFPGAGGEEFEYATRLMGAGGIELTTELETYHAFQSFWPRLKTLFYRSERFPQIYKEANANWQRLQFHHFSRVLLSGMILGNFVLSFLVHQLWWVMGISIVGFIFIDFSIMVNSWRWGRVKLLPLIYLVRILQYCMIGIGSFVGMFKVYV